MKAFFKSHFSYCPLIWMCCNCSLNDKRNRLLERCLHIVYSDKKPKFEKLLEIDSFVSIHHQNSRFLAVEMFKVFNGMSPQFVEEVYQFRDTAPYQLGKQIDFQVLFVHSVFRGTKRTKLLEPKI